MRKGRRLGIALAGALAAAALAVGFAAYRRPALVVDLANQLRSCF